MHAPPPKYKLKVNNADEHQALLYMCNSIVTGQISAVDMLARQVGFAALVKEVEGKTKYRINLSPTEACTFRAMCHDTIKYIEPEPYNRALYQRWANDIHQQHTQYYTLINA